MSVNEVRKILESAFPKAEISVADMTGTQDHFQIQVVSSDFKGKSRVEQHQIVQRPLQDAMSDGRIHAIAIKTYTPEAWEKEKGRGLNVLGS